MSEAAEPVSESEVHAALSQMAGRRTLPVPADLLVRHALALPGSWDWPVRRAAFEAILRRLASARAQEIAVIEGPRRGPWGRYLLGRADVAGALPYDARIFSVAPIRGSCDCADYLRGSLGLCKHLGAVLMHLASRTRTFRGVLAMPPELAPPLSLVWDAAASAPGRVDPLESVGLTPPAAGRSARAPATLARLFHEGNGEGGVRRLRTTYRADPRGRLRLVKTLEEHVRRIRGTADPAARAVLTEERVRLARVLRLGAAPAAIDEDRPHDQTPEARVPSGIDRHAHGEPTRRAGLDWSTIGRSSPSGAWFPGTASSPTESAR